MKLVDLHRLRTVNDFSTESRATRKPIPARAPATSSKTSSGRVTRNRCDPECSKANRVAMSDTYSCVI